jgi:hypothetical protein
MQRSGFSVEKVGGLSNRPTKRPLLRKACIGGEPTGALKSPASRVGRAPMRRRIWRACTRLLSRSNESFRSEPASSCVSLIATSTHRIQPGQLPARGKQERPQVSL